MTKKEKREVVERIHLELKKTKAEIIDLKELTQPISPENAIGRVSRMDAINNKGINDNRLRLAENKIKKLNHALANSQSENFGSCSRCDGDIQIGRLMLLPESSFCVRCAS